MAQRTDAQNRALHLWFQHIADMLNDSGFEQKITIGPTVDVPWTKETVKILYKKIAKAQYDKIHTAELTTGELTNVAETMNRYLADQGIHVPFPSEQELLTKISEDKQWKP